MRKTVVCLSKIIEVNNKARIDRHLAYAGCRFLFIINDMEDKYYTSGEFARRANVTLRTIRYYDKQNILAPSFRKEDGSRFYTDQDFARLQQILLLKYLGFSLQDIREMTIAGADLTRLSSNLKIQKKLLQERIEEMHLMVTAIDDATDEISKHNEVNWDQMLKLIHMTSMENSLKSQYQNTTNIEARINLHSKYSTNKQGWFPWVYQQCEISTGMKILEIGCGDGSLWAANRRKIPDGVEICLSDISDGMVRDVKRRFRSDKYTFEIFDGHKIPFEDESFDLVIANHVLFYCDNIPKVLKEIRRVLKLGGRLVASTYGRNHMHEITDLVQEFDEHIVLSGKALYESFGLENGEKILKKVFSEVECRLYEDSIELSDPEPLIEYILSCHGNQNQILLERYSEFHKFVTKKVCGIDGDKQMLESDRTFVNGQDIKNDSYHICKEAGVFICKKC